MSLMLGNRYLMDGRYQEALEQFRKVLAERPNEVVVYYKLGIAYLYLKRFAEAVEVLHEAIRLVPDSGDAVRKLALAYLWQDESERAVELVGRHLALLEATRDSPMPHGYLHVQTLDRFLRRLSISSPSASDYASLGILYFLQGSFMKALSYWDLSLKMCPDQPHLLELRGRIKHDLRGGS